VGVQVKLRNPSRTRAIPECFCGGVSLRRGVINIIINIIYYGKNMCMYDVPLPLRLPSQLYRASVLAALRCRQSWKCMYYPGSAPRLVLMRSGMGCLGYEIFPFWKSLMCPRGPSFVDPESSIHKSDVVHTLSFGRDWQRRLFYICIYKRLCYK